MNTLRLVRMLFSRWMLKELLLVIQVVLMVLFFNAVILPFENIRINREQVSRQLQYQQDEVLCYQPSGSYFESWLRNDLQTDTVADAFKQHPDVEAFGQMYDASSSFLNDSAIESARLNLYESDLASHMNLPLAQGSFLEQSAAPGTLPVVISANLAADMGYELGSAFTFGSVDGAEASVPCTVTGILEEKAAYLTFVSQNSVLCFNTAFEPEGYHIFACYDAGLLPDINWDLPMILRLRAGADIAAAAQSLSEEYAQYGEYKTIEQLFEAEELRVRESSDWNQLMLILFILVLVFGYGGYTIITAMQKGRLYAVLYMNGLSFRRLLWLNILAGLLLFVPAVAAGLALTPVFLEAVALTPFASFTAATYGAVALVFLGTFLFSIGAAVYNTRRLSAVSLYRRGE